MASPTARPACLALLLVGLFAGGSAEAQSQGPLAPDDARLLQAARLIREGKDAEAEALLGRLAQAPKDGPQPGFLGPVRARGTLDPDDLVWAARAARSPRSAKASAEAALKELRPPRVAAVAWLALQLDPDSDEAEWLHLLLATAYWWLGLRQEALAEVRPLTEIRWDDGLLGRAIGLTRSLERELKMSPQQLAAEEEPRLKALRDREMMREVDAQVRALRRKQGLPDPRPAEPPAKSAQPEEALPEPRKAVSIDDAVALLASQDLAEWRHAQRVLFRHGPPAVPALLRATREQNRRAAEGANHVLNMLAGEEYAKALLAALDDPVLAEHARTYLQRLKTDGEASLVAAAALQAARPYRQRQTLMYIIAELPFPSTKEALLRLTRDDNPRVRSHAFYVLWSVPGDDVTQRLIEGVADPDPRAVQDAIDSLGKRKARAALPLLCELVGRPRKDGVTVFAMEALARMGDLRAAPVLIAQLRAPPEAFERPGTAPGFRAAVARALKQLTGQDFGEDTDAWSRWLQEKAKETAP